MAPSTSPFRRSRLLFGVAGVAVARALIGGVRSRDDRAALRDGGWRALYVQAHEVTIADWNRCADDGACALRLRAPRGEGFCDNEVRLQRYALAYNLISLLHCIELPKTTADWSLTSRRLKLIMIGAHVMCHALAITIRLAEMAVAGPVVRAILTAIHRLRALPSCA
jgi:hypothetical protein